MPKALSKSSFVILVSAALCLYNSQVAATLLFCLNDEIGIIVHL